MYAALKFLHIAAFAVWFAGLLALPWIFAAHSRERARVGMSRLGRIERTVFFGIASPAAVLAIVFGALLLFYGFAGGWLHVKLTLMVAAVALHIYCGTVMRTFLQGANRHGPLYFRALAQAPLLLLVAITWLASAKPF